MHNQLSMIYPVKEQPLPTPSAQPLELKHKYVFCISTTSRVRKKEKTNTLAVLLYSLWATLVGLYHLITFVGPAVFAVWLVGGSSDNLVIGVQVFVPALLQ